MAQLRLAPAISGKRVPTPQPVLAKYSQGAELSIRAPADPTSA